MFLLPCRLQRVIEFQRQFMLKAKATRLRLRLGLSQSLSLSRMLPVLFSQGLVLVLIKAVSFCLLPAFSTAYCELRGNTDTERRGKRWRLNPADRENKLGVTLPSSQSEHMQRPSKGQRPGIGSLHGTVWGLLSLQSFSIATMTAAPSSRLRHLVWRSPGTRGQSALWLGVNQRCSQ